MVDFKGKSQNPVSVNEYTEKSQDKAQDKHVQLVREYGFHPRSKAQVEDGSLLPRKFEPFPSEMYGRPLEEIDHFIYEEVRHTLKF
jgi:voltage-gated cation channel